MIHTFSYYYVVDGLIKITKFPNYRLIKLNVPAHTRASFVTINMPNGSIRESAAHWALRHKRIKITVESFIECQDLHNDKNKGQL